MQIGILNGIRALQHTRTIPLNLNISESRMEVGKEEENENLKVENEKLRNRLKMFTWKLEKLVEELKTESGMEIL